jgi:hypothetical protein
LVEGYTNFARAAGVAGSLACTVNRTAGSIRSWSVRANYTPESSLSTFDIQTADGVAVAASSTKPGRDPQRSSESRRLVILIVEQRNGDGC